MFEICACTHSERKITKTVLDGNYAISIFNQMTKADDVRDITILDAYTGELIMKWKYGQITYLKDMTRY